MIPISEAILNAVERMHIDGLEFAHRFCLSGADFMRLTRERGCVGASHVRLETNYGNVMVVCDFTKAE